MKGVRLACLYSYKCDKATRLGINGQLLDYVQNYDRSLERKDWIVSMLKKLLSYPGYQRISKLIKRNSPFNERVVRTYWLGNRKLRLITFNHNFATLEKFRIINADEHLRAWIIKEMLDCAISFGKVLELSCKKAKVLNHRLLYNGGRVIFGPETREVDTKFVPNLKKGDLVSIHWAIAREKISKNQAETLENITLKALQTLQIA